jgi:hypothetical protein
MPHPSTNHLISRVRDFCRWQETTFGDPSARGAPLEDPIGWANDKEFWILNTVWRDTIFEGNADDSMAAADALIDHGLLRAKRRERDLEVLERTATVRVREQTFRAFAVSKSILSWKDQTPARFEEILSARAWISERTPCGCAFPAHAGMNRRRRRRRSCGRGVPRACGDEPPNDLVASSMITRSPRMRG